MTYYVAADVKTYLTEAGTTNNAKIQLYGDMADAYINSKLTNVEPIIPIPDPNPLINKISTLIAVGYFYKFESGDQITVQQAQLIWDIYFNSQYKQPKLLASTGTPTK